NAEAGIVIGMRGRKLGRAGISNMAQRTAVHAACRTELDRTRITAKMPPMHTAMTSIRSDESTRMRSRISVQSRIGLLTPYSGFLPAAGHSHPPCRGEIDPRRRHRNG